MPVRECLVGQCQAQMRFSSSWRAQKNHIGTGSDKGKIRQFSQLPLRERWLKGEIEPIDRLFSRNTRCLEASGHRLAFTPIQFGSQGTLKQRLIGPLFATCLVQKRGEDDLQLGQVQLFVGSIHAETSLTASTPQY